MASGDNEQNDVDILISSSRQQHQDTISSQVDNGSHISADQEYSVDGKIGYDTNSHLTHASEISEDLQPIICVICLELAGETATAVPCRHDNYHFSCLITWLQQNRSCPLCKAETISVQYSDSKDHSSSSFHVTRSDPRPPAPSHSELQVHEGSYASTHPRIRQRLRRDSLPYDEDPVIQFRRSVYEQNLRSLYTGNNHISGYRNVTPTLIRSDASLLLRARKWIRRELRIMDPYGQYQPGARLSAERNDDSVFRNVEFLLEYIVAILKNIDLRGSAGQAETLLGEHLGRATAALFLHEIENWLRSPFTTLEEWDSHVQYRETR